MAEKKKGIFNHWIVNVALLIPSMVGIVYQAAMLITKEASLAGRSAIHIVMLSVVAGLLITSTWLGLLVLLCLSLVWLKLSWMLSVLAVVALNVVLLLLVIFIISKEKKNLTFPRTRKQCRQLFPSRE